MKKLLAIILALILALSMGLLAGCGEDSSSDKKKSDDEEKTSTVSDKDTDDDKDEDEDEDAEDLSAEDVFKGEWEAEVNAGPALASYLAETFECDEDDFKGDFDYTVIYEFKNGKVNLSVDGSSVDKAVKGYKSTLKNGIKKAVEATIENEDLDMTVDEFISENTTSDTLDDYVDEILRGLANLSDKESSGTFEIDGDEITLDYDDADEAIVCEFKILSKKKFKLVKLVSGGSDGIFKNSLPITFVKR